jgi:fluoride ion exporter CrcB/FEX
MFLEMPTTLHRTTYTSLVSIATLLLELVSAFCIGLVIRGSKKPERSLFYLSMTCLVMAAAVTSYFYLQQVNPLKAAIFTMNGSYVVGVLVIGVCALIYANWLWTRERLLRFL